MHEIVSEFKPPGFVEVTPKLELDEVGGTEARQLLVFEGYLDGILRIG